MGSILGISLDRSAVTVKESGYEFVSATSVNEYYEGRLSAFLTNLEEFETEVNKGSNEPQLIPLFLKLRCSFKETEFLLNYVENNFTRRINGPNLQWAEGTINFYSQVMEPHGLQVMENLIYHPGENSRIKLQEEIIRLKDILNDMSSKTAGISEDRSKDLNSVVWDAIRLELFRVESLGITGFDVPDSKNSIPEVISVLHSLSTVVDLYEPVFNHHKELKHLDKGRAIFKSAIRFCRKHNDFDRFDHLTFIKEYLHPLSKWVHSSIRLLNYNDQKMVRPVSDNAVHLFDANFMNPEYFLPGTTSEKAALGKRLFFDPIFSKDGSRSCASCHNPDKGYADGLIANSKMGSTDLLTRNTPSLWNAGWQTKFFYDSRARSIDIQIETVIQNHEELAGNLGQIAEQLSRSEAYKELFQQNYQGKINSNSIIHALGSYILSLTSNDSPFDKFIRGESKSTISRGAKNGFNLFMGKAKCATCHFLPNFNGLVPPRYYETESEILGVAKDPKNPKVIDDDKGKSGYTGFAIHQFAFKTPGLRNIDLTAPYMHNGAYKTLNDVIEFYNNGGGAGQGMVLPSQTLASDSLKLNKKEIQDIILFLKSLTDESKK